MLLLIVTFLLRLWGIKQGLPYSYNSDEATHFVPRAVAFFSHDLNPHYFLNPPAYSYLLHIVFELWFGSADAVMRAYASDPTGVFVIARVVAAVLGTIAVWLTYLAGGRFFNRTVGLLAAAIFGLAFLPIFYSHLALNDVPTLAPVALSLYGIAGVFRRGRPRDYAIAGIGIGLAAATKYTGGITLVCLLGAFVSDAAGQSFWSSTRRLALALVLALGAFLLANPYALLDFSAFQAGVSQQASLAAGADPAKLGSSGSGITYYLWTFTWGLGWGPALAAIGGAVLLLARRRLAMALVLLPAPIAFIIFMGDQQRFFGRWLMPIFPIVAMLAAYGAVELVRWLARTIRLPVVIGGAARRGPAAWPERRRRHPQRRGALASRHPQPDPSMDGPQHSGRVEGGDRARRARTTGRPTSARSHPSTPTGDRWYRFATWLTDLGPNGQLLPDGERRYVVVDQYERTLRPELLDEYVVEGVLLGGRGLAPGGPCVRRSGGRAERRPLLRRARRAGSSRLSRQPVFEGRAPDPVQLRLVDRLLPTPVPPARVPR